MRIFRAALAFALLASPAFADFYGDRPVGSTLSWTCSTMGSSGPATLSGGTVAAYKDASNTQTTTGVTLGLDQDWPGRHVITVDTSADGTFYSAGSTFEVVITAGTVGGTSFVGLSCGSFSLHATSALRPATAGRTLVVSSGGVADAQVKGMDPDTVTASAVAADAIGASEIAADTVGASEIAAGAITSSEFAQTAADLTWSSVTRTLTSGGGLTGAQTAAAVWGALLADYNTPLTFGANVNLLDDIEGKTDLISAGGVTITTPYNPTTGKLTLTRGDDYPAGPDGIPPFTSEDWPDLTGATVRLTIRTRLANGTGGTVLLTMTDTEAERIAGTGEQSITFEPLSELGDPVANNQEGTTNDLTPGNNTAKWDIQATLASGAVRTLAVGLMDVVEDITRP